MAKKRSTGAGVFLGWSGRRSRAAAREFDDWLTNLFGSEKINVFISEAMEPGTVWFQTLTQFLRDSDIGLIMVTEHNLDSAWIHFESGVLFQEEKVAPVLVDVEPSRLANSPLAQLQAKALASNDQMLALARRVNYCRKDFDPLLDGDQLAERFESHRDSLERMRRELPEVHEMRTLESHLPMAEFTTGFPGEIARSALAAFLGTSHRNLPEHIKNAVSRAKCELTEADVFFVPEDYGVQLRGESYSRDVRQSIKRICELFASEVALPPSSNPAFESLDSVTFWSRPVETALYGGSSLTYPGEDVPNVIYSVDRFLQADSAAKLFTREWRRAVGVPPSDNMKQFHAGFLRMKARSDELLTYRFPNWWDLSVEAWDHFEKRSGHHLSTMKALVDFAEVRPGHRVLDLGAGQGRTSQIALEALGGRGALVLVDSSALMLQAAARVLPGSVDTIVADAALGIPTRLEPFDRILCHYALHTLRETELETALTKWHELLVENGEFAVAIYNREVQRYFGGEERPTDEIRQAIREEAERRTIETRNDSKKPLSIEKLKEMFGLAGFEFIGEREKRITRKTAQRRLMWEVPAILNTEIVLDRPGTAQELVRRACASIPTDDTEEIRVGLLRFRR